MKDEEPYEEITAKFSGGVRKEMESRADLTFGVTGDLVHLDLWGLHHTAYSSVAFDNEVLTRYDFMSDSGDVKNLENSQPTWISDHLGEKSYMADEVNQLPFSSRKDLPSLEDSPSAATPLPIERETNITHQGDLDRLRESYSIPPGVHIRLPEVGETIVSTRPGEVAFYEAAFHAGLHLPIHPIIRRILRGQRRPYSRGIPTTSRDGRRNSSLSQEMTKSSPREYLRTSVFQGWSRGCGTPQEVLEFKTFRRSFRSTPKAMASSGGDNGEEIPIDGAAPIAGNDAMSRKIDLGKLVKMVKGSKATTPKSSKLATPAANGVVIREKHPWDESSKAASRGTHVVTPGEGTSAHPSDVLGLNASMLENPTVVEKLLEGVVPPFNREEVVVIASSLVECDQELRDGGDDSAGSG
ncbi:hypothetical protein Acr_24g0004330 [Actinidia rufa]|uniref:Uncharacterized protein n=1 Tax=Actinidia rufa TaxID=165716 RepID=A0A7J0GTX4_9ERIC|nr:hypothetical protein Acr_24g0004330 [Actinidia rufa]